MQISCLFGKNVFLPNDSYLSRLSSLLLSILNHVLSKTRAWTHCLTVIGSRLMSQRLLGKTCEKKCGHSQPVWPDWATLCVCATFSNLKHFKPNCPQFFRWCQSLSFSSKCFCAFYIYTGRLFFSSLLVTLLTPMIGIPFMQRFTYFLKTELSKLR